MVNRATIHLSITKSERSPLQHQEKHNMWLATGGSALPLFVVSPLQLAEKRPGRKEGKTAEITQ